MSNLSKKPPLEHLFPCRNSQCPKPGGFTTERGLHIHYGKSLHYGAHAAACQAYIRPNNIIHSHPSPSRPWDIADDNDTSVACVAHSSVPTSNNIVDEETDVDKVDSTQKTNQFGIKCTAEHFTQIKLLKILNDVAAPHFLYQDILYLFCPQRLEQSSQVKCLEKWLQLKPCHPEMVKLVSPGPPAMQAIQVTQFSFTN
jgi:hypothetical protein